MGNCQINRPVTLKLTIRDGIVREEFILLGRKPDRTRQENERLIALKQDMADRLLSFAPEKAYDATSIAG